MSNILPIDSIAKNIIFSLNNWESNIVRYLDTKIKVKKWFSNVGMSVVFS